MANLVARGDRGQAFDEAVVSLAVGALSAVFKEGDSYYVVKLLERTPERVRPYAEARGEIVTLLRAEREQQVYAERKDQTLFTIHSRRTTLGEFLQELNEFGSTVQQQYTGVEGKRKLLDSLIERLLVVEDASEQATEVKRKDDIEHARADLLARLLHQEEVDEKMKVSDDEVRAEYERNQARYADPPRVRVNYIRVDRGTTDDADQKARAKMEEAEAKLKPKGIFGQGGSPANFAEVAKQYSEDTDTAANGGAAEGWLSESGDPVSEMFEHALHEQILPLKVGEISPVLPLGDSYFLFQVREKEEARQRSFEEVQPLVRQSLEARKHEELSRAMQNDLLKRMQLQIYDGRIQSVLAELGTPLSSGR